MLCRCYHPFVPLKKATEGQIVRWRGGQTSKRKAKNWVEVRRGIIEVVEQSIILIQILFKMRSKIPQPVTYDLWPAD